MRKFSLLSVLLIPMFLTGCGDSHEAVMSDTSKVIGKVATALEGVTDKASAEAAAEEIKSLAGEMEKISARAKSLGEPDAEEAMKSLSQLGPLMEATTKMQAAITKLQMKPELLKEVQSAFDEFQSKNSM